MHIWLVTSTEPIPSDKVRPMRFMGLAEQLLKAGHQITIWTTTFCHQTKAHRFLEDTRYDVMPGYQVTVLQSRGYRKNVSVQRLLMYRHFAWRLARILPACPQPDLIVTNLPPLDTVAVLVKYGEIYGVPVVLDVIDPWPDIFLRMAPIGWRTQCRLLMTPLFWQTQRIFRQLSGVTALSQTYLDWALEVRGKNDLPAAVFYPAVSLNYSTRWAQAEPTDSEQTGSASMRFVYAGSLSKSYDVETIIACARCLTGEGFTNAEFHIAGDGPKAPTLNRLAEDLPSVKLWGWLGAGELSNLFADSHVGIACYVRGATQSITYKLFDYLGAGLPILCSLPGEMSDIIRRQKVGYSYPAEDSEALAEMVRWLSPQPLLVRELGRRARAFAEQAGDSRIVYRQMVEFLEQLKKDFS